MPRDWRQVDSAEALLDWTRRAVQTFQLKELDETRGWNTAHEFNLLLVVAARILEPDVTALFRPFTIPDRLARIQLNSRIRNSIFWQFQMTLQHFVEHLEARIADEQLSTAAPSHTGRLP